MKLHAPAESPAPLADAPGFSRLPTDRHLGYRIKQLQNRMRQVLERTLAVHGLEMSFASMSALAMLAARPGRSGAGLARDCFVSPQTMHGLLRRMESDGWIARTADPDNARIDLWHVTPGGAAAFERGGRAIEAIGRRLDATLGQHERVQFEQCIDKLMACLNDCDAGHAAHGDTHGSR